MGTNGIEQAERVEGIGSAGKGSIHGATREIAAQERQELIESTGSSMSPASSDQPAAVGIGEQSAISAMAAGSCLVVDQYVRQYCMSNPDDISCQFQ